MRDPTHLDMIRLTERHHPRTTQEQTQPTGNLITMHTCRFGHDHDDKLDVLLCLTTAILERETTMTESIDQGFTDLSTDLDALDASEQRELAFLQDLENARGNGQLSPDQQTALDALRARIQGEAALLDAADAPAEPAPVEEPTSIDSAPVDEPAPAA